MGYNCSCMKNSNQVTETDEESMPVYITQRGSIPNSPEDRIILIESLLRGFLDRRSVSTLLTNYSLSLTAPSLVRPLFAIKDSRVPDYSTQATRRAQLRVGPYRFGRSDWHCRKKGPIQLNNKAIYIGHWNSQQERHGSGTQMWTDGSKYEGNWQNDKIQGIGRLIHSNGDVYEGEWLENQAHGLGTYTYSDETVYSGMWEHDKKHGYGSEVWNDGTHYKGHFSEGLRHGTGLFEWPDGSEFEGEFKYDKIQGFGVYKWPDGRKYEGHWNNGMMQGQGKFTWPNGSVYTGLFENDKRQGFGKLICIDGRVIEGLWKNGVKVNN